MCDSITKFHNCVSGAHRGIWKQRDLNIQGAWGLKHNLHHLSLSLWVLMWCRVAHSAPDVPWRACAPHWGRQIAWSSPCHPKWWLCCMGILQRQDTSLALSFIAHVGVLLTHDTIFRSYQPRRVIQETLHMLEPLSMTSTSVSSSIVIHGGWSNQAAKGHWVQANNVSDTHRLHLGAHYLLENKNRINR